MRSCVLRNPSCCLLSSESVLSELMMGSLLLGPPCAPVHPGMETAPCGTWPSCSPHLAAIWPSPLELVPSRPDVCPQCSWPAVWRVCLCLSATVGVGQHTGRPFQGLAGSVVRITITSYLSLRIFPLRRHTKPLNRHLIIEAVTVAQRGTFAPLSYSLWSHGLSLAIDFCCVQNCSRH